MTYHIKDANELERKLNEAGSSLVILDFYAVWCGPCTLIAPKVEDLAAAHPDIVILKIDVDECEDLAAEYEISVMPTFHFLREKKKICMFSGSNYDALVRKIMEHKSVGEQKAAA